MADLRDYTKKNPIFVGTDGIRLPTGNSAQRVASANVAGTMRYNTDIGGMEMYTPNGWLPIAAPPTISTVSPSTFSGESGTEFTINGSNFTSDAQVYFVTSNGTSILASTVVYYSPTQVRATTPRAIRVQEEPISVRVVQQSGTITKTDCIDAGGVPNWITTAGTLGSIFGANTVNVYVSATDPEGTAISYQITSGSLPGGLNFSTANGLIQGLASSVLANTTYNFTIKANDTVNNNTDRSFSYTVLNRAPVINTAAGSLGTIYSGNAASASISAYDPDGGQLTYSVSSGTLPVNSSLGSANGVITGTPIVVTTNTTYSFTITSTDEGSLTASNNYTYTVLNRPPLWNTNPTLTSYSAETFTPITVNAYDPDGGSITYSLTSGSVPSGLTFVSANATITGTAPEVTDNTTSTFTITATDPGSDANARTFSLTITPIIDAQFSNTVLLLKTAGNTVIKDASSNNLPLVVNGDSRASPFSPFNTSWSTYFGAYATDSYLTYVPGTSVAFGTGDFTVECWAYWDTDPGSTANPYIIDTRGGGGAWAFSWNWAGTSSGSVLAWTKADGNYHQASTQMPLYKWNHCAYVRSGTTGTIYLNGVSILSFTDSTNYSASISLAYLGKRYSGNQANPGYQSNLRIVKGTAVYTSNFTPPTSKLTAIANTVLLTHQAGSFKDNSTANSGTGFTITSSGLPKNVGYSPFEETDTTTGSIYFDGTGDYISNLPADILDFASGEEFSIEFFAYFNSVPSSFGMLGLNAGIQQGYAIVYDAGGGHYLLSGKTDEVGSGSLLRTQSAGTLYPYTWYHICFARRSGVMSIYVNGVRLATRSSDTTSYASGAATIGYAGQASATAMTGFMSNIRIVTGSSAYDTSQTTLTVPTSPVSNISGTRLLTFQNRQPHNNHGLIDESNNKFTIGRAGNVSQGTFTPFSADLGKWCNYFNGSSNIVTVANSNTGLGTGNMTAEFWLNTLVNSNNGMFGTTNEAAWNSSSWSFIYNSGSISLYNGNVGGSLWSIAVGTLHDGNWHHVAIVRNSGTWQVFVDGVSKGTTTTEGSRVLGDNTWRFNIGDIEPGNSDLHYTGYISNFHLANTALYTSNFTPNTTPIVAGANTKLLTCQSNYFKDNTTANSGSGWGMTVGGTPQVLPFSPFAPNTVYTTANTGGSLRFDGSGDYLDITDYANVMDLGGRAAHLEFWMYPTATGIQVVIGKSGGTGDWGASGFEYQVQYNGGSFYFYWNASGTPTAISLAKPINAWYHLVIATDASNNIAFFVNGVRAGTGSNAITKPGTRTLFRVGNDISGNYTNGIISGLRFISGNNAYSPTVSSITVPTTPPRNDANTVLLINGTSAAIYDATGKNMIETFADSKANNSISKFGESSASFDGTGDYLQLFSPPWFALGTGNFTIECWVYFPTLTNASNYMPVIDMRPTTTNGLYPLLYCNTSGTYYYVNASDVITGSVLSLNTWTHLAICRFNSQTKMFINGTQSGSTYSDTNSYLVGTNRPLISGSGYDSSVFLTGRINDLRITRSARYTANTTPPTRSFPNR